MHIREAIGRWAKEYASHATAAEDRRCVGTGLSQLDLLSGGLRCGRVAAFAGPRESGKTALLLRFALEASRRGTPTLLVGTRMSTFALVSRWVAASVSLDLRRLRCGSVNGSEWDAAAAALPGLADTPFWVIGAPLSYGSFEAIVEDTGVTAARESPWPVLLLVDDADDAPSGWTLDGLRAAGWSNVAVAATTTRPRGALAAGADALFRLRRKGTKVAFEATRMGTSPPAVARLNTGSAVLEED